MLKRQSERVAQAVEHVTFNHGVEGSSPSALTKKPLSCRHFFKALSHGLSKIPPWDKYGTSRNKSLWIGPRPV
jgi:hypothetical protein